MPDDLKDILDKCLDSPGYVIMVGVIGPEKEGVRQVNFEYRRYHFPLDDAKATLLEFKKHLQNDIVEGT